MTRRSGRKPGAGAMAARIVLIILVMVAGGVGSFFASKAFFANRFKEDKKDQIAKQLKEESKERVDVALVQVGSSMTIRIYHNKNQQMIYVPLCSDMVLTLTDEGKKAIEDSLGTSVDTATVSDVAKATKDGELVKEQVEETLGITINNYESITTKQFVKLMDKAGEIKLQLDEAITYEDLTDKSVTLPSGTNTLNGNAVLALLQDQSIYSSQDDHMTLVGDILVGVSTALKGNSLSEYKAYVKDYYDTVKSDIKYDDVSGYLERIHEIKEEDFNYKILEGTQSDTTFQVDGDAAKKLFDELLSEDGEITAEATTEKETDTQEESSKDISIEIQNSTSISGLAGSWRDKLTEEGYTISSIKTNRQGELTHTKIIISEKGMGQDLKQYFKNPEYEIGSVSSGAKICIIVGTEDEI